MWIKYLCAEHLSNHKPFVMLYNTYVTVHMYILKTKTSTNRTKRKKYCPFSKQIWVLWWVKRSKEGADKSGLWSLWPTDCLSAGISEETQQWTQRPGGLREGVWSSNVSDHHLYHLNAPPYPKNAPRQPKGCSKIHSNVASYTAALLHTCFDKLSL